MELLIDRFAYTRFGTLGRLTVGGLDLYTVERPWRGNERNESCIPEGVYCYQRHDSPKHGETLWLRDVPGRSEILIHPANGPHQLDGCLAPGIAYDWWAEHNELCVVDSREAMRKLLEVVGDEGDLEISTWRPEYP